VGPALGQTLIHRTDEGVVLGTMLGISLIDGCSEGEALAKEGMELADGFIDGGKLGGELGILLVEGTSDGVLLGAKLGS